MDQRNLTNHFRKPFKQQGPVVQSTISAIPELNFNLLFWFMHFATVRFKTLKYKSSVDPENICGKHVQLHKQTVLTFFKKVLFEYSS